MDGLQQNFEAAGPPVSSFYSHARRIYVFFKVGEEVVVDKRVRDALNVIHARYKYEVNFKTKTLESGQVKIWRES